MASTQKEFAETFSVASCISIAVRAIAWTCEGYALRIPAFVRIRCHFCKLAQRVSDVLRFEKLISSGGARGECMSNVCVRSS